MREGRGGQGHTLTVATHILVTVARSQEYYADPLAAWKAKDCATYLVSALAVKGTTQAMGATKTNELINVVDFFSQHIVKDLEGPCPSAILTADALRYATTFRSQLPKEASVCI